MNSRFGIKQVVAAGIGTALFVVLTTVAIPLGFMPSAKARALTVVVAEIARGAS